MSAKKKRESKQENNQENKENKSSSYNWLFLVIPFILIGVLLYFNYRLPFDWDELKNRHCIDGANIYIPLQQSNGSYILSSIGYILKKVGTQIILNKFNQELKCQNITVDDVNIKLIFDEKFTLTFTRITIGTGIPSFGNRIESQGLGLAKSKRGEITIRDGIIPTKLNYNLYNIFSNGEARDPSLLGKENINIELNLNDLTITTNEGVLPLIRIIGNDMLEFGDENVFYVISIRMMHSYQI